MDGIEQWCPITGFEDRYMVSNMGRVMSLVGNRKRRNMILKVTTGSWRYPSVALYDGNKLSRHFVHAIVAREFIGPRSVGMQINHIDGNRENACATNLEYCTPSENMKHAFRIGLQSNNGERHSQSKLKNDDVLEILQRISKGEKQAVIASDFGVGQSDISKIKRGKSWSHISMAKGE